MGQKSIFVFMQLRRLLLTNYKNQKAFELDFEAPINAFVGNNGVGKTNLLDAIYHLALGKSYFNPILHKTFISKQIFLSLKDASSNETRRRKLFAASNEGARK